MEGTTRRVCEGCHKRTAVGTALHAAPGYSYNRCESCTTERRVRLDASLKPAMEQFARQGGKARLPVFDELMAKVASR